MCRSWSGIVVFVSDAVHVKSIVVVEPLIFPRDGIIWLIRNNVSNVLLVRVNVRPRH